MKAFSNLIQSVRPDRYGIFSRDSIVWSSVRTSTMFFGIAAAFALSPNQPIATAAANSVPRKRHRAVRQTGSAEGRPVPEPSRLRRVVFSRVFIRQGSLAIGLVSPGVHLRHHCSGKWHSRAAQFLHGVHDKVLGRRSPLN